MKLKIYIFTIIVLGSCTNKNDESISISENPKSQKHADLIYFSSKFEMGMDELFEIPEIEYQRLTDRVSFHSETDTVLFLKDTLYISYLTYVNACAAYAGDIKFSSDTLFLTAINIKGEECTSGNIDRFVYKIFNPENKKYHIVKF